MGPSLGAEEPELAWHVAPAATIRALIAGAFNAPGDDSTDLGEIVLRAHQRDGVRRVRRVIDLFGGALLADDVGMGKTFTALAAARAAKAIVVVAPAPLRPMWHDAARRTRQAVTVLSYEQLSAGRIDLPAADFVIADEAHHARNPRTRRYDALARLTSRARVLLLTATPIHNREHDLRHLLALFLGSQALDADDPMLRACTVRRLPDDREAGVRLPSVSALRWLPLPHNERVVDALSSIPGPVPPQDGGSADALLAILLLRLWCSSDWALRSALRRLQHRASALTAALQEGRYPSRDEMGAWLVDQGALQLAFAPLVVSSAGPASTPALLHRLDAHQRAVGDAIDCLAHGTNADAVRQHHLERLMKETGGGVVAFTQFEDTARGLFRRLRHLPGVVVLSSRGGESATGRLSREEVLALAHPDGRRDPRLPLRLLIATDLLSEGVNLGQLQHLVHLDLPWTPARAHQRLGRLRRPESRHTTIDVSAFELPVAAERLVGVLRTLQAKAQASGRLIGEGDLLSGAPWAVERARDPAATAQLDADAELRSRLLAWKGSPDATIANNSCSSEGDEISLTAAAHDASEPLVGLVHGIREPWEALVLAHVGGLPQLLVLTEHDVSDSPAEVLRLLDSFDGEDSTKREALRCVRRQVAGWLSARRAEAMIQSLGQGSSRVHAQALRALAQGERSLPRTQRLHSAARNAQIRHVVLAQRGIGAERAIAELIPLLQLASPPASGHVLLDALGGTAVSDHANGTFDGEPRVIAVLVAVP